MANKCNQTAYRARQYKNIGNEIGRFVVTTMEISWQEMRDNQIVKSEASKYPVSINKPARFLYTKDDGIYTYMYEIGDDIQLVKDNKGEEFTETFLT